MEAAGSTGGRVERVYVDTATTVPPNEGRRAAVAAVAAVEAVASVPVLVSAAWRVYLMEPYYGGSHKTLVDRIKAEIDAENGSCGDGGCGGGGIVGRTECNVYTLPAKKWKWRLRASAMYFADVLPYLSAADARRTCLLASSMVNLSDLLTLRPDLLPTRKVLYFHENQIEYPVQQAVLDGAPAVVDRDVQMVWSQMMSAMAADAVVFNSEYNMASFTENVDRWLKKNMPKEQYVDMRLGQRIRERSSVLYVPVSVAPPSPPLDGVALSDGIDSTTGGADASDVAAAPLHIVWNHRWEWDKGCDDFCALLLRLEGAGCTFVVSLLGERFGVLPDALLDIRRQLAHRIVNDGFVARDRYLAILRAADVVVSTANHEFFGISVVEASMCGCFPLLPRRLVYPELFGADHLYNTLPQLFKRLKNFCKRPYLVRGENTGWRDIGSLEARFGWNGGDGGGVDAGPCLRERYMALLRPESDAAAHNRKETHPSQG